MRQILLLPSLAIEGPIFVHLDDERKGSEGRSRPPLRVRAVERDHAFDRVHDGIDFDAAHRPNYGEASDLRLRERLNEPLVHGEKRRATSDDIVNEGDGRRRPERRLLVDLKTLVMRVGVWPLTAPRGRRLRDGLYPLEAWQDGRRASLGLRSEQAERGEIEANPPHKNRKDPATLAPGEVAEPALPEEYVKKLKDVDQVTTSFIPYLRDQGTGDEEIQNILLELWVEAGLTHYEILMNMAKVEVKPGVFHIKERTSAPT